jgi:hypothetical protein
MTRAPNDSSSSAVFQALTRHFADLRDGTHGEAVTRSGKERHFENAVGLLDPFARRVLEECNHVMLLDTGKVETQGLGRNGHGDMLAAWNLSWPEQRRTGIQPVSLLAHYGTGFHHPHLRGTTVHDWPLNVFNREQAADMLPVLGAIVAADLHNLVFQRDFRIIPAVVRHRHETGMTR